MDTIDILEIKKNNLQKMKTLADRQEQLVCNDQMKEFLVLAGKRERIRREIDSDQKKYKHLFDKAAKKERDMAEGMNQEISEIINSIMEVDKKVEQMVAEKKDVLLGEIKGLKKGRTAVKGYGQKKGPAEARFIKRVG